MRKSAEKSRFKAEEKSRMANVTTILPTPPLWKRILLVLAGSVLMAVNLKTFVYTADLFPGGFTGLARLIQRSASAFCGIDLPFSLLYLLMNAFPVYISFRFIGKKFTIFSLVMIVVSSVLADLIAPIPVTDDVILCSVFGGILNGLAVVLCLWADATSGGTDFIAIYFSVKKGRDMWNVIFGANCLVLAVAGFLFGWNAALYSIIFQFASTQILNILYQRYKKNTLLVVTEHPDEIYAIIKSLANHDATKIEAEGCYKGRKKSIVYTVVSSDQVKSLSAALKACDHAAFINVLETKELLGRFFTKKWD